MTGLTARSREHHFGPSRHADHFVYRCYDKDGDLIYIGCTSNVKQRMAAHRRGGQAVASRWLAVFMDRHEVEGPFRGRDAARDVERAAIHCERPLFNYQHTADETQAAWMTRSTVARYLVERRHIELALKTLCACWPEARAAGAFMDFCVAHIAAQDAGITSLRPSAEMSDAEWRVSA